MTSQRAARNMSIPTAALALLVGLLLIHFPVALQATANTAGPACRRADVWVIGDRSFMQMSGDVVEISSVTLACAGCHDGTVAKSITIHDKSSETAPPYNTDKGAPGSNHPIGMPYPFSESEFVALGDLDPRLSLADGKVTCLTCHIETSPSTTLSVPITRSRLCLSCHTK
ncbi:MAG: hypothetical protein K8R59_15075 [Thermoanaerobaculales bacterium]|nr:hypothetical protein [Thermoanaerobaculales bacterium]